MQLPVFQGNLEARNTIDGPGTPPRVSAAGVRKVKSNNATVRLRANPISSEQPYFILPRVDAGENIILEAGSENRILNGIPYSGSWSGSNVSTAGVFSPVSCGTYKLFYSVPDLGIDSVLCTVVGVGQTSNPAPVVITGPDFICDAASVVQFTGIPAGGNWSSNAAGGSINSAQFAGSLVNITYTKEISGCTYTQSKTISVYPSGIPLASTEGNLCQDQTKTLSFDFQMPGEYQVEWYKNGSVQPGQNENFLQVGFSGGTYKAKIRPAGSSCSVPTDSISINPGIFVAPPAPPALTRNGNNIEMTNYPGSSGNKWYRNGELIAGQTASSITPVLSGIYHAIHSEGSCTSDYSNGILFQGVVTGADVVNSFNYVVYPNPVGDFFRITHTEDLVKIGLTDMLGRKYDLRFNRESAIDMRSFGRGIYVLDIQDKKGKVKKMVLVKQ